MKEKVMEKKRNRKHERGMTLVEIMVVLVIISMVVGLVGVQVFNSLKNAQIKATQTQMARIAEALDLYRLSYRQYPSSGEGLAALKTPKGGGAPVMEQIPQDPWGNDYVYIYPGQQNSGKFDLISYGPDGQAGGGDDITNGPKQEGE
jgi:general secretion pathway protein G